MEQHWGWLIVIYLFFGGLGAGAYLSSYAAQNGWLGKSPALQRTGFFIAAPVVAVGTVLLVLDLGQGLKKPWLLIGLLSNFRSVMTWGVYILALFILVGFTVAYFALQKKDIPKSLLHFGAILALATGTYTGLLIAVVKAVPFWNTYVMPVLFVVSALSTGLSLTAIVAHTVEKGMNTDEHKVTKIHLGLLAAEIVVLAIFLGSMLSGSNGTVGVASANMVISGSLAVPFWVVLVGLGIGIPFIVFILGLKKLSPTKKISPLSAGLHPESAPAAREGAAALAEPHGLKKVLILSDAGVIIGGFALRYVIVFASFPIWDGILK